jgi:hypothetical protein
LRSLSFILDFTMPVSGRTNACPEKPGAAQDLFGRELLAVDGTRIKAVNNKDRNFTRASLTKFIEVADAKLDDYLQRLAAR